MQYNQTSDTSPSVFSDAADTLVALFNAEFASDELPVSERSYLIAQASEPIYLPYDAAPHHYFAHQQLAQENTLRYLGGALSDLPSGNKIFFTCDYFASALHEIAHWCIAGKTRRRQVDYGYWYAPDGRSLEQQKAFEQAEIKPQAIEWAFSLACNKPFKVSNDNLSLPDHDCTSFANAVYQQLCDYQQRGFMPRAQRFLDILNAHYNGEKAEKAENAEKAEQNDKGGLPNLSMLAKSNESMTLTRSQQSTHNMRNLCL
ncbi:elongation factor P hydroxylase [Glaciecola siphonariae]|uniref:Elongation factor P hydroxylase n=1 Tax=Glaciecola siphonariae TaxID=521012 RepID=A0ABV9LV70_9ALTE